jgi:NitT/TauT family transport system substrate-binding protein
MRLVLVCVALALSIPQVGCHSSDEGEATVTIGFFPAFPSNAGLFVAMDKGFYRDEQLNVRFIQMEGGRDIITAVASGRVDFGIVVTSSVILAQEDGAPITIVGMKQARNPIGTVSLKEKGITTPADYSNRRFASNSGSVEFQLLPILMKANGADSSTIRVTELDFSVVLGALLTENIDVATAFYSSALYGWEKKAKEAGKELNFILWSDYGLDMYGDAFITGNRILESRPEVAQRFMRATVKGFTYGIEHQDELSGIIKRFSPTEEPDTIQVNWTRTMETMKGGGFETNGWGWVDEDRLANTRTLVLNGLNRTAKLEVTKLYSNDFLPGILPNLTSDSPGRGR